jgi:hypothetical protein
MLGIVIISSLHACLKKGVNEIIIVLFFSLDIGYAILILINLTTQFSHLQGGLLLILFYIDWHLFGWELED